MITATQAAKMLCEYSGFRLTNLELQKMMYIAHMLYMGEHDGARLIDGRGFEAWAYGPVSPVAYRHVQAFGSDPIGNVFRAVAAPERSQETIYLEDTYNALKDWTPGQLVGFTHRKGGAWDRCYDPNQRNIIIPDEAILDEYRRFHV